MTETIVKWTIVVLLGISAMLAITNVGKPRKPLTGGIAAIAVVVNALMIASIIVWWG